MSDCASIADVAQFSSLLDSSGISLLSKLRSFRRPTAADFPRTLQMARRRPPAKLVSMGALVDMLTWRKKRTMSRMPS